MNRPRAMRALLISLCMLIASLFSAHAQGNVEPLAQVQAGEVTALAVSRDGSRLFAADAEGNELRIFSLSADDLLSEIAAVELDGTPTALTAARDYALVTIDIGTGADALQSIGADRFNANAYSVLNIVDIADNSRFLTISPDDRWALLTGERWFSIIQVISETDIIGYPTGGRVNAVTGALGGGIALVAQDSPAQVTQYLLRSNQAPREARSLRLSAAPSVLMLNDRATIGAVVVGRDTVLLFDAATMQELGRTSVRSSIIRLQFAPREDGEWLALSLEDDTDIHLFDVTDPEAIGEIGSFPVGVIPLHMLLSDDLLIISDGREISVYPSF